MTTNPTSFFAPDEVRKPANIERLAEEASRSSTKWHPGDRVYADRLTNPGHGTVVCCHRAPHYVCVTVDMDNGERARVEASRVSRSDKARPAGKSAQRAKVIGWNKRGKGKTK